MGWTCLSPNIVFTQFDITDWLALALYAHIGHIIAPNHITPGRRWVYAFVCFSLHFCSLANILSYILEIGSWHYEFCIEFWQRRSCGECKLYRSLAIWESTISTRAGNSLGGSINRIHHIGLQCPTVNVRRTLNSFMTVSWQTLGGDTSRYWAS